MLIFQIIIHFSQGTFVGMLTSLIFTMWIGFGQTVAKNFGEYTVPTKETTIEGCPPNLYPNATDVDPGKTE